MLAERSLRTGPGSMVGSPVAEVVVVQVDEILLSNPGGRLRRRRWMDRCWMKIKNKSMRTGHMLEYAGDHT